MRLSASLVLLARSWVAHALFLPAASLDVVDLPPPPKPRHPELDYVHELNNSAGYIRFAVPATVPRSLDYDASYTFELRVLPVSEPCGVTNIELNGRSISRQWLGAHAAGQDYLSASSLSVKYDDTVNFSWHASCLDSKPHPHQVLTVAIGSTSVADLDRQAPVPGFTISFDHQHPEIILLSPATDLNAHSSESAHSWENPAPDARLPLAILPVGYREEDIAPLRQELEKLHLLPPHPRISFHDLVEEQKAFVDSLWCKEFDKARDEIRQCQSLACMVKTAFEKTKGILDLAYLRYGPVPKAKYEKLDPECLSPEPEFELVAPQGGTQAHVALIQEKPMQCSHSHGGSVYHEELEEPYSDVATHGDSEDDSETSLGSISPASTASFDHEGSDTDGMHNGFRVKVALGVIASLLCLTCLTTFVHARCCSPRARADRLARREERRTRMQYRCLARKQALRDWWSRRGFGGRTQPPTDYEEKRALVLEQEKVLERAMQRDIEQLRSPQRLARDSTYAAEEGLMYPPSDDDQSSLLSRSNSLPGYRSRASSGGRPPSYKETDENSSSVVTNGFVRYTPSGTEYTPEGTDITPDSSVAEISPRHSSETLRTEYGII